ncbi:class I SAM-dependent methyltransferase [Nocardioides sp.]|uniref:class I SAM-dependent methyltransferase n=1 Tax=Nocardioides sp. TaxID=35761 RepID=UPI002B2795F3|nr:methyltransferase domain-containing protein [Nocardioides sp.]
MSEQVTPPTTRWAAAGERNAGYGEKFAALVAEGADVDGEARLADVLVGRGARILDVGSGMGRVSSALAARGHDVLAVEPDPPLVAQSRATYPDLSVVEADAVMLTPERLAAGGHPTSYDLVVCVGNVMILLAEGTERQVLTRLATLLAPGGRILVGFHVAGGGPDFARHYSPAEFTADVEASGLQVDLHAGSYELHPPTDEYAVWVLSAPGRPAQRDQG